MSTTSESTPAARASYTAWDTLRAAHTIERLSVIVGLRNIGAASGAALVSITTQGENFATDDQGDDECFDFTIDGVDGFDTDHRDLAMWIQDNRDLVFESLHGEEVVATTDVTRVGGVIRTGQFVLDLSADTLLTAGGSRALSEAHKHIAAAFE